jgi:hypothetical protein
MEVLETIWKIVYKFKVHATVRVEEHWKTRKVYIVATDLEDALEKFKDKVSGIQLPMVSMEDTGISPISLIK